MRTWCERGAEPDFHRFLSLLGIFHVGSEQTVPDRKIEPVVGIRLVRQHRVMNAVHVWSDDQKPQGAVQPKRQADIGVAENRRAVENDLEDQHGFNRTTEGDDDQPLPEEGQQDFDRMEPQSRRRINFAIAWCMR